MDIDKLPVMNNVVNVKYIIHWDIINSWHPKNTTEAKLKIKFPLLNTFTDTEAKFIDYIEQEYPEYDEAKD